MMMCLTLFVACSTCSASGKTLYVGPRETCTTIQAGVDAARPGDTVTVRDGVYTDRTSIGYCSVGVNVTRGGTDEAHRITIRAEHKWSAVVDLQSEAGALGFRIGEGVCYVTIEGFEIRNCGRVSPSFDDWGVGISSWGSHPEPPRLHNTFRGNRIHHCDLGIDDAGTSLYGTIDGNVIHHVGGEYHKHAIYWTSSNVRITNNILYDIIEGYGLHFYHKDGAPMREVFVSNNTFVRGNNRPQIVLGTEMSDVTIQNNIFYEPAQGWAAIQFYIDTTRVHNVVIRSNLVHGGELIRDEPEKGFVLGQAGVTLSDNLTADPSFVKPTGDPADFHLRAGSPAIDAGIAAPAPDHDLEGKARPAGKGCDIGAYEAGGTSGQAAAPPEGYGLSARYPGDRGIDEDPAVVFSEDFEVADSEELRTRWSELGTANWFDRMVVSREYVGLLK